MTQVHRPRQPGAALAQVAVTSSSAYQPIPAQFSQGRVPPAPWDISAFLPAAEITEITDAGSISFHCVGDTGGVKNPAPQMQVAQGLVMSLQGLPAAGASMSPCFLYHLGDVIYFNGEITQYYPQFYEPYEHYPLPIVAIPGNHDGDPITAQATSLDGFYENFLATPSANGAPIYTAQSMDSGRPAMQQPFFYHTLTTPYCTIIGLYSNVPEHGVLDADQRAWFHDQMSKADKTRALIVAIHHPVYSFDVYHSGSPTMAQELQDAINASGRLPNMVLDAHVHNYQRIEKEVVPGITIPFFVIGGGGYYNLHKLAAAPGYTDPDTQAKLIAAIDTHWGFMTFDIGGSTINGHFTMVPKTGESWTDPNAYNPTFDVFSYTAQPLFVPQGQTVTLLPPDGSQVPAQPDPSTPAPERSHKGHKKHQARAAHLARTAAKLHSRKT
jgi:hypothetical protein